MLMMSRAVVMFDAPSVTTCTNISAPMESAASHMYLATNAAHFVPPVASWSVQSMLSIWKTPWDVIATMLTHGTCARRSTHTRRSRSVFYDSYLS